MQGKRPSCCAMRHQRRSARVSRRFFDGRAGLVSDRFAAHPAGSGDTPRASNRVCPEAKPSRRRRSLEGCAWRRETGVILEVLTRLVNHHINPPSIMASEVFKKAVLVAKHFITGSCLLPRFLLFDARGSVSGFNAVPLKGATVGPAAATGMSPPRAVGRCSRLHQSISHPVIDIPHAKRCINKPITISMLLCQ